HPRTHEGADQVDTGEVGDDAGDAVGAEQHAAQAALPPLGIDVHAHGGQHEHDADVNGEQQDAGDGIHDRDRLGRHAKGVVERVEQFFVTEEGTVDKARAGAGDAAGDQQVEERVFL